MTGTAEHHHWCILRTSGPKTLPLARSLARAGMEVWSPAETLKRRRPRSKASVDIETPILPTFVFARARHLPELFRCLAQPINPHPSFSVFRHYGRIPLLADAEIGSLHDAEDRARRATLKTQRLVIPVGHSVRVKEGPAQGMSGVVEDGDGQFAMVAFGGSMRWNIATFLLIDDGVDGSKLIASTAA